MCWDLGIGHFKFLKNLGRPFACLTNGSLGDGLPVFSFKATLRQWHFWVEIFSWGRR
jgi:hypothetical protein